MFDNFHGKIASLDRSGDVARTDRSGVKLHETEIPARGSQRVPQIVKDELRELVARALRTLLLTELTSPFERLPPGQPHLRYRVRLRNVLVRAQSQRLAGA